MEKSVSHGSQGASHARQSSGQVASKAHHESRPSTKGWKMPFMKLDDEERKRMRESLEEKERSEAIDRYLASESHKLKQELKVLLFGAPSQIDIFWKQTRCLEEPLSGAEREDMRPHVQREVLDAVGNCISAVLHKIEERSKDKEVSPEARRQLEALRVRFDENQDSHGHGAATAIDELYQSPELQMQLSQHGLEYSAIEKEVLRPQDRTFLTCSCTTDRSLIQHLRRVHAPDYAPTEHDWFHFDQRSISIIREARILIQGQLSLNLMQITRMGSGRHKWIHLLDNTNGLVFVFDLAVYDERLPEDGSASYFKENLMLFDSICSASRFAHCPVLALLSNVEAFRTKLAHSPLSKWFPRYDGRDQTSALEYMKGLVKKTAGDRRGVHIRACEAVVREEVRNALEYFASILRGGRH